MDKEKIKQKIRKEIKKAGLSPKQAIKILELIQKEKLQEKESGSQYQVI